MVGSREKKNKCVCFLCTLSYGRSLPLFDSGNSGRFCLWGIPRYLERYVVKLVKLLLVR